MAVAIDHYMESGCFRVQVESAAIMQHVDGHTANFDHFGCWQRARPRVCIDVAADGGHGGKFRESFKDLRRADITGMEDAIGSAERFDGLRAQQAVGVGDHTNRRLVGFRGALYHTSVLTHHFITHQP